MIHQQFIIISHYVLQSKMFVYIDSISLIYQSSISFPNPGCVKYFFNNKCQRILSDLDMNSNFDFEIRFGFSFSDDLTSLRISLSRLRWFSLDFICLVGRITYPGRFKTKGDASTVKDST